MQTKFYTPHILLQEFVNCIMVVHAEMNTADPVVVCYPPTPQHSLFFYINDRIKVKKETEEDFIIQPRSVVVGMQSSRVTPGITINNKAIRVGLHPGGMRRLFYISTHQ